MLFKRYLAVVEGIPEPEQGRIDKPLGPDPEKKNRMRIDPKGKRAVTEYSLLGGARPSPQGVNSLVRLALKTGRTHQIRVHMASIGCPLLGDPLYGNGPAPEIGRTALHAQSIHFLQPFTGEVIWAEAPVPEDLAALLSNTDSALDIWKKLDKTSK